MARQIAVVGTAAVGMTVIIISTEIDLSVGSAIVLAAMVVFWGGEGSILGTIVGALIMKVIKSECAHLGIPNYTTRWLPEESSLSPSHSIACGIARSTKVGEIN